MLQIPRRISLSSQIAAAIRKAIAEGLWEDYLPGERRLCELFHAGRPTVRTALRSLAEEGLIEIHHGKRSRLPRGAPRKPSPGTNRTVGVVIHEPFVHLTSILTHGFTEMRLQLAERGFKMEVYVCPAPRANTQKRGLETFIRQQRVHCCVLVSASLAIQSWFSDHSVPALVLGSCHPTVKLPSLDIDYRAICRHAAGTFLAKGHRHLALIIPDFGSAGDLSSEESFRAAIEQRREGRARASIVRHSGTAASLRIKLDALFDSEQPPTALLVARTQFVWTTILYLLNRGLKIPDAVSLIARDDDPLFKLGEPPLAHYSVEREAYVKKLCRSMLQLTVERPDPRHILVVPKYQPGKSVKALG